MTHRFLTLSLVLTVGASVAASAQAPAPAPAPVPVPATEPAQVLPPVVTVADPLMREIDRHIADSAALASMSARERYLRLQSDNRYLESILKDQDKRIDALERRLAMLKEQREKSRAEARANPAKSDEDIALEKKLSRLDRLMPVTQTGTPKP